MGEKGMEKVIPAHLYITVNDLCTSPMRRTIYRSINLKFSLTYMVGQWHEPHEISSPPVLGKLLFKSNLSMSTITWLEK